MTDGLYSEQQSCAFVVPATQQFQVQMEEHKNSYFFSQYFLRLFLILPFYVAWSITA